MSLQIQCIQTVYNMCMFLTCAANDVIPAVVSKDVDH